MTYPNLIATVGRTPLVELGRLAKNLPGRVFAKLEMRNPCGSVKDRVGVALIEDAESRGLLKPGMTIVEATGGNTGVGLAFVAAVRSYELILTMPETMSVERVALIETFRLAISTAAGHSDSTPSSRSFAARRSARWRSASARWCSASARSRWASRCSKSSM